MQKLPIKHLICLLTFMTILVSCGGNQSFTDLIRKKEQTPNCPKVKFLKDADKITSFRNNNRTSIRDIEFEAKFAGFAGECEYVRRDGKFASVALNLQVLIEIVRGPALKSRQTSLRYFVAIPEFFPNPQAKISFQTLLNFPLNRNNMSITDKEIEIKIPLKNNRYGPNIDVLIGFELTPKQLKFNRLAKPQRMFDK